MTAKDPNQLPGVEEARALLRLGAAPTAPLSSHEDKVPFVLGCKIGQGGSGIVYTATHAVFGKVAVKVLMPEFAANPLFSERFARELEALNVLAHPNIVNVLEYGAAGEYAYLVMEEEERSLRRLIEHGPLPFDVALRIGQDVALALEHAHGRGIVHRDIKPENVLITKDGRAKVCDFGLARLLDPDSRQTTLTATGFMGTPHYIAPEQIREPSRVDHRADIFSLGVILYEMTTGRPPLGSFSPPHRLAKTGPYFGTAITRCLRPDPQDRPPSVLWVRQQLEKAARVPAFAASLWRWREDHAGTLRTALLGLMLPLTIGLAVPWLRPETTPSSAAAATADLAPSETPTPSGDGEALVSQRSTAPGLDHEFPGLGEAVQCHHEGEGESQCTIESRWFEGLLVADRAESAELFKLDVQPTRDDDGAPIVKIRGVAPGSFAEAIGLEENDLLSEPLNIGEDLLSALERAFTSALAEGEEPRMSLMLVRGGNTLRVELIFVLPEKLAIVEIKAGLKPTKEAAMSCGRRLGASGENVSVKLEISGATGKVLESVAQPPHAGTELGDCVAAEFQKAQFTRFRKKTSGVLFSQIMQ